MPKAKKDIPTPILDRLIKEGAIFWDDAAMHYIGKAGDGQEVLLGWEKYTTEHYLASHPSPKDW